MDITETLLPLAIEAAERDDDPSPPTHYVSIKIPRFASCDTQNCDHEREYSNEDHKRLLENLSGLEQYSREPFWRCRDCDAPLLVGRVHLLQCKHILCRGCLVAAARRTSMLVRAHRQRVSLLLSTRYRARVYLDGREKAVSVDYATSVDIAEEAADIGAFQLVDSFCCGRMVTLAPFLDCMDPDTARQYWVDIQYMESYDDSDWETGFCGWPDCGSYVPHAARFLGMTNGFKQEKHYCVICEGSSVRGFRGFMPVR